MNDFTFYQILGISKNASNDEIKYAYRNLASKFHPDKTHSALSDELMKKVNQAYETLSDPKKRKYYDESLEKNQPSKNTQSNKTKSRSTFWTNLKKASKIYGIQAQSMGREISRLIQEYQSRQPQAPSKKSSENVIHHYHHYENKESAPKKQRSKKEYDDFGFNMKDVFDL